MVVKVGGDVLLNQQQTRGLVANVKDLIELGWSCVILHGGGPQVTALQKLHGLEENKVGGRRVTGIQDLQVVKQALCGEVNVNLVSALISQGVNAFGCHGASGRLIGANRRPPVVVSGSDGRAIDFGEVGDVSNINKDLLIGLLDLDLVPVIASLGVGKQGEIYNINADTTAVQIALSLAADALILSTEIGGIFRDIDDPDSRISTITASDAQQLVGQNIIRDGMIPKVEEAIKLLKSGVARVAITNAALSGSFIDAISQNTQSGTHFLSD